MLDGYSWTELARSNRQPRLAGFFGLRLHHVRHWLQAQRLDVLIVTGWNSFALVQSALAARRLGIPVLVRGDANDVRVRRRWTRVLHQAFLSIFAAALVVGRSNRRFFLQRGVPPERLFDCPHFVDNDRIQLQHAQARQQRQRDRAKWGVPEDAACALFAGKLIAEKNVAEALAALRSAVTRAPLLHLLIVGDGPLREQLETVARAARLPVSFTGFLNQSEIPAAYAAADFLVLPSRSETWGLVVNEAMACGLPAVVSDRVGCAEDLVAPSVTGFVYRSGDPDELATKLVTIASDAEVRAQMGRAARHLVTTRYSVQNAVAGTLEALRAVGSLR